jgi:hypothetical protein
MNPLRIREPRVGTVLGVLHHLASQDNKRIIVQCAVPVDVVGVGGHEKRWNRSARIDEAFVEGEPAHPGHLKVGNQASCPREMGRREEISCTREYLDRKVQSHEPSHGLAEEMLILDHRNQ